MLNFIWAVIWPFIEPIFNNTEEEVKNLKSHQYKIDENDKLKNTLELAGDKFNQDPVDNSNINQYAMWMSRKCIAIYENARMPN